jgi:hypothetical protein
MSTKKHDEVRIRLCPSCERLTVDRPAVVRACSCFNGHGDSADYETVAVFHGPAAKAVWALFLARQLATDEEFQGERLAAGADSVEAAIAADIDVALGELADKQTDPEDLTLEQLAEAFKAYVEDTCQTPQHVVEALYRYELDPGVAEKVGLLLEAMPTPEDRGV